MQARDLDAGLDPQRRVEIGERLVEQEDLRVAHDRAADGDALALAARELARLAVEQVLDLQHLGGRGAPARRSRSAASFESSSPNAMLS